jgi:hypothetical protein
VVFRHQNPPRPRPRPRPRPLLPQSGFVRKHGHYSIVNGVVSADDWEGHEPVVWRAIRIYPNSSLVVPRDIILSHWIPVLYARHIYFENVQASYAYFAGVGTP